MKGCVGLGVSGSCAGGSGWGIFRVLGAMWASISDVILGVSQGNKVQYKQIGIA